MNKIKIKSKLTIETEYEFDESECVPDPGESMVDYAKNWINEDFYKVLNRADNVLPDYIWNIEHKVIE